MARFTTTTTSLRTPEEVFDYLADMRNAHRWDPGVSTAVLAASGKHGDVSEDATFDVTLLLAGRPRHITYRLAHYDRPRRAVLEADDPTFGSLDTISVTPQAAGGCEVTYDAVLEPKGPWKVATPLVALAFSRIGRLAAAGLARELGG